MKMETGGRGEKCIKKNLKHVQDGSENVVMEECFETREGKLKKKQNGGDQYTFVGKKLAELEE